MDTLYKNIGVFPASIDVVGLLGQKWEKCEGNIKTIKHTPSSKTEVETS
jgi:hypothetical protein